MKLSLNPSVHNDEIHKMGKVSHFIYLALITNEEMNIIRELLSVCDVILFSLLELQDVRLQDNINININIGSN